MLDFVGYIPTKYIFGRDTEKQAGEQMKALGCKKVLIHYGGGSAVRSGLLDRVKQSLEEAGLAYCELGGVKANPVLSKVQEGVELVKKEGCDGVLAVGGGSVIDSAKAIGIGAGYDGDVWDFYCGKNKPQSCLPLGSVLTIPAAGSEASGCSVITKEEGMLKRGPVYPFMRVSFCIMNPELTMTLPAYQTAAGATDMFSHVCERYFTKTPAYLMNRVAEQILKAIMEVTPKVLADPSDYDLRAELMWIGTVAHNNTCGYGVQQDWASHHIEHELSGIYDVTHGAGLAIITPAWMKYVYRRNLPKFVEFAVNVFDVSAEGKDEEAVALEGIARMEAYFRSIGMPTRLSDIHVDSSRFTEMAEKVIKQPHGFSGNFEHLTPEDIVKIFELAQ